MSNEAPKIGLSGIVVAPVISDDENGIVYGAVVPLAGAVVATVNPNSSVETDYADNGAFYAQNNRGNTELSLEMIDLSPENEAMLLGQRRVNGVNVETDLDQSPYFAFGGKILIAGSDENGDARYEYFWYAKGKFSVPESGGETKRDTITFGHKNLTAQFVKTQYIPAGQSSGTIGCRIRTDDSAVPATLVANWFNQPIVFATVDTSEVTVTAALSSGKVVITGTKDSGADCVFAASSVVGGSSVIVTDAGGAILDGAFVVEDDTITFTPDSGTPVAVTVTSGVKDTNGVSVTPVTITL